MWLAGAFLNALSLIIGFVIIVVGMVTSGLLQLAATLLNFVLSPDFISLSYTNPADNAFIATGWGLTRGLTNIVFVLALVAIGLGTALRINNYQAKKALPLLIIIALLINFTPVLLGVIVDATNIVMNFFLQAGFNGGNVFSEQTSNMWTTLTGGLDSNFFDPSESANRVVGLLTIVFFNLLATLVFFLFTFIFIMRYIIIWLLVILSPIAFAFYILPATRGLWSSWWKQFIQWSIIGVNASFFLYLSNRIMDLVIRQGNVVASSPGGGAGIVNRILPWGIVIAFLYLGLGMALSTSARGAGFAMGLAQKTRGAVGGFAARRGIAFAREKMPKGVSAWAERQATARSLGADIKGPWGKAVRGLATPLGWARAGLGTAIRTGISEKGDTDKAADAAKKRDAVGNVSAYRQAASEAEREGIMRTMIGQKQLKDAMDVDVVGKGRVLTQDELLRTYKKAVQFRDADTIEGIERGTIGIALKDAKGEDLKDAEGEEILLATKFAEMIDEATKNAADPNDRTVKGLDKKDSERYTSYVDKIIGEAKTADEIKQLKKGWWNKKDLMSAAHHFWGGQQIGEASRTFGRSFSDKFQSAVQERGLDWYFEIEKLDVVDRKINKTTGKIDEEKQEIYRMRNPDVPRYLIGNGAAALGIGLTGVKKDRDIDPKISIGRIMERYPILAEYDMARKEAQKTEITILETRRSGREPSEAIKNTQRDLEKVITTTRERINSNPELKSQLDNIEILRQPKPPKGQQKPPKGKSQPPPPSPGPERPPQSPPPGWAGIVIPPPPGHKRMPLSTARPTVRPTPTQPPPSTSSASPQTTEPPSSVLEAIEKVRQEKQQGTFKVPIMIGRRLKIFLQDNGITQEEFDRMKPDDAWNKAIEIAKRFKK